MRIRRPLAAIFTALTLFGGGATLTACGDPAGLDRNDGTSDDDVNVPPDVENENGGPNSEGDDDQSNQDPGDEDDGDDVQSPD